MGRMVGLAAGLIAFAATAAAAQYREITQSGPFRHDGSRTVFPEKVGNYERGRIVRYEDPAGEDVSVGYHARTDSGPIILTEYVYPAPAPSATLTRESACQAEFDVSKAAIEKYGDSRKLGEPAAPAVAGIPPRLTHQASYSLSMVINGAPQTLQSDLLLYCYVGGNWFVKYRSSSPPGTDSRSPLSQFVATGPWPGRK